jgi:hypothetical protein
MEWNFNLYFWWWFVRKRKEEREDGLMVETKLIDQAVWFGWLCEN